MQEFMLLVRNEIDHQDNWSSEQHREFLKACESYIQGLKQDGKLKNAQPMIREGKMISGKAGGWQERPFNDDKEVIVGYYHVLARDINEAIEIAKQNPEFAFGQTARVEVRPLKMKEVVTGYVYPNE